MTRLYRPETLDYIYLRHKQRMTTPSIEKMREQISNEMNARRTDGKTYIDSEWLLAEYEKKLITKAHQAGLKSTRRLKSELAKYKKAHKSQQKTISKLQEEKIKAHQAGFDAGYKQGKLEQ